MTGRPLNNGITTENNVETFTYQVTDANGNTTTSTITIDVIDDIPTAHRSECAGRDERSGDFGNGFSQFRWQHR